MYTTVCCNIPNSIKELFHHGGVHSQTAETALNMKTPKIAKERNTNHIEGQGQKGTTHMTKTKHQVSRAT